jgi:hypothetical protein
MKAILDFKKKDRKYIALQNYDKLLLGFITKYKYIDEAAAKILLSKKNDRAFWRRVRKLIAYNFIRKSKIAISSAVWGVKPLFITVFSLDSAGCDLYYTKKIKTIGVQGEHLKHSLLIRRVAAILERLKTAGEMFDYETEPTLDEYSDERIYIDNEKKYRIRPDIFIKNFNVLIEVELTVKPDRDAYAKRLFWSQYLKNYNKTVWLVGGQNDKEKLIKIFTNYAGESFKYDPVLDKKMIFSDVLDKNFVVVFDDFFYNPETFLRRWTGLN